MKMVISTENSSFFKILKETLHYLCHDINNTHNPLVLSIGENAL